MKENIFIFFLLLSFNILGAQPRIFKKPRPSPPISTPAIPQFLYYPIDSSFSQISPVRDIPFNPLGNYISVYEDTLGTIDINAIANSPYLQEFVQRREIQPNASSVYWLKLNLCNPSNTGITSYLNLELPGRAIWDDIRFYMPGPKTEWTEMRTGYGNSIPGKILPGEQAIVPVTLGAADSIQVFIRFSGGGLFRPVRLFNISHWDYPYQIQAEKTTEHLNGIFLGIILIQLLYFFLLFISTQDISYGHYVLYILGLALVLLNLNYLQNVLENPQRLKVTLSIPAIMVAYYGFSKFTISYLEVENHINWKANRVYRYAIPFFIFSLLLFFLLWPQTEFLERNVSWIPILLPLATSGMIGFLVGSLFLFLSLGVRTHRAGQKVAKYYLIAFFFLFIGIFVPLLAIYISLATSSIFKNYVELLDPDLLFAILQVGIILQLSFNALGVGYKNKMLEEEKLEAQQNLNKELGKLNSAYERFVPHEFLQALGHQSVLDVQLGDGVLRDVTVFFSDIRAYTTLSEQMSPQENFSFLNDYLGRVGPVIHSHHGFVNQFYGDGVMAIFRKSAMDAVTAAIQVQQHILTYNRERSASGLPPISTGIGLHTGSLMMGIIGDGKRFDTGVVADTVNTASRMEGLTKHFGVNILLSEDALENIQDKKDLLIRFLGRVVVKGKNVPISVYDVFNGDPALERELKLKTKDLFQEGMESYYAKKFQSAQKVFEEILRIHPNDQAVHKILSQARRNHSLGVDAHWDGVEVILNK